MKIANRSDRSINSDISAVAAFKKTGEERGKFFSCNESDFVYVCDLEKLCFDKWVEKFIVEIIHKRRFFFCILRILSFILIGSQNSKIQS